MTPLVSLRLQSAVNGHYWRWKIAAGDRDRGCVITIRLTPDEATRIPNKSCRYLAAVQIGNDSHRCSSRAGAA